METPNKEMVAFIGYVNAVTKDPHIKKRSAELLTKYWSHPKEDKK